MPKSNLNRGGAANVGLRFAYLYDNEPDELKRFKKHHVEDENPSHRT